MILIAGLASADTIRLHPEASVESRTIRLADIATLHGPAAQALAQTVVADWPDVVQRSRLSLAEVRDKLADAGANWALISLEGPPQCRVAIVEPTPAAQAPVPVEAAPALTNQPIDTTTPPADNRPTLRTEITARLVEANGRPANDLRVTFTRGANLVDRPITGPTRLRPSTSATLGLIPINVETLDDTQRVTHRQQVIAKVERRAVGLKTTRSLRTTQPLDADDVELAELWLDHPTARPLGDASLVLGQRLRQPVGQGTVLYPGHLQEPDVIHRGDLVTVRNVVGGMVITSVGTANHDAAPGEPVELRRPRSRETFTATAVGPQQATLELQSAPKPADRQPQRQPAELDPLAATVDRLQQGYLER